MIGIQVFAGLCNRIFQLVFGYSYAKKNKTLFRLENWIQTSHHSFNNYAWLINRFINTPYYESSDVKYTSYVMEDEYRFTEYIEEYNDLPDIQNNNYLIRGFFQNEKYFKEYRDDIIELLKEPDFITDIINSSVLNEIPSKLDDYYFIHIRMGDFVNCPKHWVHLENYYIKAIEKIKETNENPKFLLFSNNIEQFKIMYPKLRIYLETNINYKYINHNEVVTFYLMLRCRKGGICGNSTFCWWPAWLNENKDKEVYFPSRWMRMEAFNNNIDIQFEGSKIIEV